MKFLKKIFRNDRTARFPFNNRGTWGYVAMGVGTAAAGYFGSKGKGGQGYMSYQQLPDYPESEAAREKWTGKLKEWEDMPGYGAVSPEWGDIWERAKGKIKRHYWGGPEGPGVAGKVRASAAARGVSESPALETELTKLGMREGTDLKDFASEMAIQEAQFEESGRQSWLTSMQSLAGMKPAYLTSSGTTPGTTGVGPAVSSIASAGLGAYQQQKQTDWWENLLKNYGKDGGSPTVSQPSITPNIGVGGYGGLSSKTVGLNQTLGGQFSM